MLWKPPRMVWSSTGERSPFSQGVNRTPCAPGGTDAAISFSVPKKRRVRRRRPVRRRQGVAGEEQVVAQPGQARAPRLVLVGHEVAAGDARGDRGDVGQRIGLLEGDVAADPARRADVEVAVEVGHGARADGGGVQVAGAGDDRRAGQQPELVGRGRASAHRARSPSAPGRAAWRARDRPARSGRRRRRPPPMSRLSVTQWTVMESCEARANPVRRRLR